MKNSNLLNFVQLTQLLHKFCACFESKHFGGQNCLGPKIFRGQTFWVVKFVIKYIFWEIFNNFLILALPPFRKVKSFKFDGFPYYLRGRKITKIMCCMLHDIQMYVPSDYLLFLRLFYHCYQDFLGFYVSPHGPSVYLRFLF